MRDVRQAKIFAWTQQAFTVEQAASLPQRGLRLLEEAIEAFQAAGGDSAMAHKLVDYVFSRPPGVLHQELGGVGVCILALAAAAGLSADEEERREVERVLSRPIEEFKRRNAAKSAAGFLMLAPSFEDGGKPRNRQALGPHATQQGAATPGQGATVQGAAQAAGNVAEPQLGPTPDRAERPPSSPSLAFSAEVLRVLVAHGMSVDTTAIEVDGVVVDGQPRVFIVVGGLRDHRALVNLDDRQIDELIGRLMMVRDQARKAAGR